METAMFREVMDQRWTLEKTIRDFQPQVKAIWKKIDRRPLFLIGTGASYNACTAAKEAFVIHRHVFPQVLYAAQALAYPPEVFNHAAVLLVSQSGESHETKLLCRQLKQTDAVLIGVTMNPASTLAFAAQDIMRVDVGSEVSSATKTYTAQLLMMTLLALDGCTADLSLLQEDVALSLQAMNALDDRIPRQIAGQSHGYIAGVQLLAAAAVQASLMLKEKCFLCYEGMSINELRHGTIEAVTPGMNIILLCSGQENLAEAETHIAFLNQIGAQVLFVHDTRGTALLPQAQQIRLTCRTDRVLSPLVFAVFGQIIAERIAHSAGYDVDGFRYLSKVVTNY